VTPTVAVVAVGVTTTMRGETKVMESLVDVEVFSTV